MFYFREQNKKKFKKTAGPLKKDRFLQFPLRQAKVAGDLYIVILQNRSALMTTFSF